MVTSPVQKNSGPVREAKESRGNSDVRRDKVKITGTVGTVVSIDGNGSEG